MDTKSNSDIEFGLSPYTPPWPEWSDSELNAEKWEVPKIHRVISKTEGEESLYLSFTDQFGHCDIPPSLKEIVDSYELLETDGIIVPKEGEVGRPYMDYDGISPAITRIVMAVSILSKINNLPPFPTIEEAGNHFCPLPISWRPWHHVYSNCKAGKGQMHKPVMNAYGKYVVRLFYLGYWRRITVDAFLPVEADGNCVLPSSGICRWPQLLTKAMLKIASLSWTHDDELAGWDPLYCLTGWCPVSLFVNLFSPMQLWKIFLKLLPNPDLEDKEQPEILAEDIRAFEKAFSRLPQERYLMDYRVATCPKELLDPEAERMGPVTVLVGMKDLGTVLLMNVRVKRNPEHDIDSVPTPRWKRYRWKDWAIRHGFIQEPVPPTLRLITIFTSNNETIPEEFGAIKIEPSRHMSGVRPSKKISKAGSKSSFNTVEGQEFMLPFETIQSCIGDLRIYLRPSSFSKAIRVNSLTSVQTNPEEFFKEPKGAVMSYTTININLAKPRITPCFYLLFDSEFYKNLFVSITSLPDKCLSKFEQSVYHSKDTIDVKSDREYLPILLAEEYDWRNSYSGIPVSRVISSSTAPTVISLRSGMCALRMWLSHPPRHFSILLASQTPFVIGGREVVVERMQNGSESLRTYESAFTRATLSLVGKTPKTKEHLTALEAFHMSYLPPSVKTLEDCLSTPLALSVKSKVPSAFAAAIRLLGDDVMTGLQFILEVATLLTDVEFELNHLTEDMKSELSEGLSFCDIIKNRISDGPVLDKKRSKVDGHMKSLITKLFEESGAGLFLLRHMLSEDSELLEHYPFKNDLNATIYYEEFKGTYRTDNSQKWAPLFRIQLNHCLFADKRPTCTIHTMVSIGGWEVIVTDTNTLCDITNFAREPRPFIFKQGDCYSILCYLIMSVMRSRDIQWNLRISGLDKFSTPHCCLMSEKGSCKSLSPKTLSVKELVDYYIPNSKGIIGRSVVTYFERIILSLRIVMSCPTVDFLVKVTTLEGQTREFKGKGELILPYFELGCEENHDSETEKEVYLEIVMIGDSWELNECEKLALKSVIEKAKARRLVFSSNADIMPRGDSRNFPRMERKSRIAFRATYPDEAVDNAATWSVSIAIDSALIQNVKIDLDRRQDEEQRNLKMSWEKDCPGRFRSGQKLRQQFLELMWITTHRIYQRYPPIFSANVGEEKTVEVLEEKEALHQLSKFRWIEKLFYENHAQRRISCTDMLLEQTSNLLRIEEYLDNLIETNKNYLKQINTYRIETIKQTQIQMANQ